MLPPYDGSVYFPEAVDFHLKHNPDFAAYAFCRDDIPESYTEITFLEFGRAAHRAAHHLRAPGTGSDGEVVAILANADALLYQTVVMGIMRAGLTPFPVNPRNSPEAIAHLLKSTSCHRVVGTPTSFPSLFADVSAALPPDYALTVDELPSGHSLYPKLGSETAADPFEAYPPPARRPALTDIGYYLHSSGSTGFPKAIPFPHQVVLEWFNDHSGLGQLVIHDPPIRMAGMGLPPFHFFGIQVQLTSVVLGMISCSIFPPVTMFSENAQPMLPAPDKVINHVARTKTNVIMTVPVFLQVWSQDPQAVEVLKAQEFINFAGGPLPTKIGERLVQEGVFLGTMYGATEIGAGSHSIPLRQNVDDGDWGWIHMSETLKKRWVPQGDGTFELQTLVSENRHFSVENLPDVRGYATKDLFVPHPTKEGLWKIVGRLDDVIVLSNGEKTVPPPMEDIVAASPYIQGCVMFGHQRTEVGILVEPTPSEQIDIDDEGQVAQFRNKIWPVIEQANKIAPAFSRIFKEMILITKPDKPMVRLAKGTVMRKATLAAYDAEISALYETVAQTLSSGANLAPKSWAEGDIEDWLAEHALDIQPKAIDREVDLFQQGFDSLGATFLRNRLVSALRASTDPAAQEAATMITQNVIYGNPSVIQLAAFVAGLVLDPHVESETGTEQHRVKMEKLVELYSGDFRKDGPVDAPARDATVLLTGSTGSLGTYILSLLLADASVKQIYAYNRPSSIPALQRHQIKFEDAGLDTTLLESDKLVFVDGDAAQDHLGLQISLYEQIRDAVTLIIHNAWKLDFNLSLASFEPNIRGTRNLVDLALEASAPHFVFTSSIGSAQSWDKAKGAFPEELQPNPDYAIGNGYGESKWVAEQIIACSGLPATSLRLGQISGGLPNGAWSMTDWMPILIKSSLKLGSLPDTQGLVDWIPMHIAARAVIDSALGQHDTLPALNVVHPGPIPWSSMIHSVADALVKENIVTSGPIPIAPVGEWFSTLEHRALNPSEDDLKNIPALQLLDFFRAFSTAFGSPDSAVVFATEKAQAVSAAMADTEPLGAEDVQRWIRYWSKKGFL
ncbi:hypothetical protein PLICRDRAFT_52360 [Plicaturopsis crispa FD-325 SS-3]|nr:hypothetical protein PLICRDRAFT_52360 [Plicaturopsis crispa FD-325 SS-3]